MVYRAYATQATQAKRGPPNLLSHTIPVGVEFFSYDNAVDHVNENALQAICMFRKFCTRNCSLMINGERFQSSQKKNVEWKLRLVEK